MFVGLRHVLLLSVCLILAAGQAGAVALGKIEVTSHLGEAFFAEAPLQLEDGEKVADVTVETAAPSDYQILEVFRDPALSKLTVEVVNDLRGPRAVISSTDAIDTPYFNLVLKLRYGHATNFKKYPVFLDLPEQVRPSATPPAPVAAPQPVVTPQPEVTQVEVAPVASAPIAVPAPVTAADEGTIEPTGSDFNPYEGWARTSRYGPMVRGDSVSTVARRLRVDERYTLNQVMVGLYNKNRDKFREDNINLINAGTYLNVPTAQEIESVPASQAEAIIKQQEQRWKQLRNQPVYAAEAEAQQNRYRTRVHVGQNASGEAAAPVQQQTPAETQAPESTIPQPAVEPAVEPAANDQLRALQDENLRLKQALEKSEARAASAPPASADAAAAEEQVKKLELTVARLQRQLKLVNEQLQQVQSQEMNGLTYAMAAVILLLIGVAGYLMYMLRRDRPHPSMPGNDAAIEAVAPEVAPVVAEAAGFVDEAMGEAADMTDEVDVLDNEDLAASLDAAPKAAPIEDDSLLFESKTPTAEAGVDYLAEAEVYLRYGMDEEALQQMHLAIEQKPDNLEAHKRLVQFLQSREDQAAMLAAVEAARSALSEEDLAVFESEIGESDTSEIVADDGGDIAEATEPADGAGELDIEDLLADMDADAGEAEQPTAEADQPEEAVGDSDDLDVAELGFDTEAAAEDEPAEDADDESVASLDTEVEEKDGALDFVSTIDIAAADDDGDQQGDASDDEEEMTVSDADDDGLAFEVGESEQVADEQSDDEAEASMEIAATDADDISLDDILGELDADEESVTDFASAGEHVTGFQPDEGEDVPETVIDGVAGDGELQIDEILGEFAADEEPVVDAQAAADDGEIDTVIEADASDDDLGLDDILGEFESYQTDADEGTGDDAGEVADSAADIAAMPDMDVSEELDDLLAEWGDDGESLDFEAGPESLDVDRARSLIAEGSLDDAESALQSALEGERRGDALIGLAEVAAKRGDTGRAGELLAEAESLLNDGNREWFESVKNLSA